MKNRLLCTFIAIIMLAICFSVGTVGAYAEETDNIVIVIDPGHGGDDPGNTSSIQFGGDYESHHVYDISSYVRERLLQYNGITVYLTREALPEDAECPSLSSRPYFAKEMNADAFVSIHTNAYTGAGRAYGAEIWVPDKSISFNNQIAVDSHAASSIVLASMNTHTGVRARSSSKTSISSTSTYSTGEKADKLAVISGGRKHNIPVVMLIETCFASDESDYNAFLSTTEKRMKMGYAIADGLASYYNLSPRVPTNLTAIFGNTLADVPLPDGWSWIDPTTSVGNSGTNHFPAAFTGADSEATLENLTVIVKKATPSYEIPQGISADLMSTLSDIALPDGWSWVDGDTVIESLGTIKYLATYTPSDTENYEAVRVEIYIDVICTSHVFEGCDDTECPCGFTREAKAHEYTGDCDAICNICSNERDISHAYDDGCDPDCNACGETREIEHVYDSDNDASCNVCGYTRDIEPETNKSESNPEDDSSNESTEENTTFNLEANTETATDGATQHETTTNSPEKSSDGCGSSIDGIFAVIASIAIGFVFAKNKKHR